MKKFAVINTSIVKFVAFIDAEDEKGAMDAYNMGDYQVSERLEKNETVAQELKAPSNIVPATAADVPVLVQ